MTRVARWNGAIGMANPRANDTISRVFLIGSFCALTGLVFGGAVKAENQPAAVAPSKVTEDHARSQFYALLMGQTPVQIAQALSRIKSQWRAELIPMALEIMAFVRSGLVHDELQKLIRQSASDKQPAAHVKMSSNAVPPPTHNDDLNAWYVWLWNQQINPPDGYANFKADLYRHIDKRFERYFRERQSMARVRLDEIRWGGVKQDGIPPLHSPKMLAVAQASYLDDSNIVFGIEINGDARAYPKRILAWHEMFTDSIGGVNIAGVYCTLCGTVIPFRAEFGGVSHQLGTSGFLYRSNKLMYDKATQSLWSTTRGIPVLGPLVDKGIQLEYESVVTTTWGEWRRRHPKTTVLSLDTGYRRNYGEGVAYASYFGTDELMFNTPFSDQRLANKQEVLALRFAAAPDQQLAIDTAFLNKNPLYANQIGLQPFVVLTDKTGANRVYNPGKLKFVAYDQDKNVRDQAGTSWTVHESWLESVDGRRLPRLPYHRAFWFGWRAAFPQTRLIQ